MFRQDDKQVPAGWNYRVIRHTTPAGDDWFAIHEVYYDKEGIPHSVTESPASPFGETHEDLLEDMKLMQLASKKPTLDYTQFSERG